MYYIISVSIIALFLSYLDSRGRLNNGMFIGFIMVTFLAMIHYDYGNDYMNYYAFYKSVSNSYTSIHDVINYCTYRDVGWSVLNYCFQFLGGFYSLVAIISLFEGIVFYKTIKGNLPRHLWWFGVFLYLFSTSFYLLNFSMLRQGFVISVFVSLFPLIARRKWWIVLPILYLASLVHGSAVVLLPFAFWGYIPFKNGKVVAFVFLIVLALLYLSTELLTMIQRLAFESTDIFENYGEVYGESDSSIKIGIGFVLYLIPILISVIYIFHHTIDDDIKMFVVFYFISAFFTPLSQRINLIGRVGYYFAVARIIAIPLAYNAINNRILRAGLISILALVFLYDYYLFFNSEVFGPFYSEFHTIFSTNLVS